jgi:hypothetical protein
MMRQGDQNVSKGELCLKQRRVMSFQLCRSALSFLVAASLLLASLLLAMLFSATVSFWPNTILDS